MNASRRRAGSLRLVGPAAILVAALFWLRDPSGGSVALSGHARHADCGVPIHAYVNEVDPRFGFERYEVQRALHEAAALWQAHSDRQLFSGDVRRRPMPVDLVFDERQRQAARDAQRRHLDVDQRALEYRRTRLRRLDDRIEYDGTPTGAPRRRSTAAPPTTTAAYAPGTRTRRRGRRPRRPGCAARRTSCNAIASGCRRSETA